MIPPLDRVTSLIEEAAAAEIRPRFGRLEEGDIREKGPKDLVTVADLAMERRLTRDLPALLAGSSVVGEEAVSDQADVQDRLDHDEWVWVIDPVDGTSNFAAARPMVAVIVALVHRGQTVAGWIHDPIQGGTAVAERGGGAWLDGRRLAVAPAEQAFAALRGSLNARYFPPDVRGRLEAKRTRFAGSKPLFCAGQEYLRLARGGIHFALFWRIKPWDHAAGVLLHAEAGGRSARLDGSSYRPTHRSGGLLMAPDQDTWQAVRDELFGDTRPQ